MSVVSNIAEGAGRGTNREFVRFLRIARGSLQELLSQIAIAGEMDLVARAALEALEEQGEQTGRLLFGLIRYRTASGNQS